MNKLFQVHAFILFSICIVFVSLTAFKRIAQDYIPIWFQEYGVEIRSIDKIGDTLLYNKSSS